MATTDPERNDLDLFEDVLNLEEQYHHEGFTLGSADGARAGKVEGRTFGLEKGFEKFSALGRLGGRAAVWDARTGIQTTQPPTPSDGGVGVWVEGLKASGRLQRNLTRLLELTDPESLSTVNDEESVNAFDDRLREAKAKATLVSKTTGEIGGASASRGGASGKGKGGEMEDFAGVRGVPAKEKKGGDDGI